MCSLMFRTEGGEASRDGLGCTGSDGTGPILGARLPALPLRHCGLGWHTWQWHLPSDLLQGVWLPHGCGMVLEGRGWLERGWWCQEVWAAVLECLAAALCVQAVCMCRCMAKRWCWLCDEKSHFQLWWPTGWEGAEVLGEGRCTPGICKKQR